MGDGKSTEEAFRPKEAFHVVGHETRVEILLALWRAPAHELTFSELWDEVEVEDSGQFTYHLSKLVDRFVGHDGQTYELLYAGHRVIDAIQSGVFHEQTNVEGEELDGSCLDCGSPLVFGYAGHVAEVSCPDCKRTLVEYPFDPGGLTDRSISAAAAAFDQRTRHIWSLAGTGVCPTCAGTVSKRLVTTAAKSEDHYAEPYPVMVSLDCDQCSFFSYVPAGGLLLSHPAVVGFLYENGVDLGETPSWQFSFVVDPSLTEILSEDPWQLAVTVPADDAELRVTFDGRATVEATETVREQ